MDQELKNQYPLSSDKYCKQSRRHGGALVGLPLKQNSKPPKLKHETLHIRGVFVNF